MPASPPSTRDLAQHAYADGRFEDAAKAFARAVDERRRFLTERGLAADRDDTLIDLETRQGWALFRVAEYEEARRLSEGCLARSLALHGDDHVLTVEARVLLGSVFVRRGRMDLAMDEFVAAHAAIERGTPVPAGTLGMVLNNLAGGAYQRGDLEGAIAWLQRALAHLDEHLGAGHVRSLPPLQNLTWMLAEASRFVESAAYARRAEAVARANLPEGHPTWGSLEGTLASAAYAAGRDLEAVERYERVFRLLPPNDESRLPCLTNLVNIYQGLGDLATAERHARAAVEFADRHVDPRHPQRVTAHSVLASVLVSRGDARGALQEVDLALALADDPLPGQRSRRFELLQKRSKAAELLGDVDGAVAAAELALRQALATEGVYPREVMRMRSTLGGAYLAAGRSADAVRELRHAVDEAREQGLLETELGRGVLDRFVQALSEAGDRAVARGYAETLVASAHASRREAYALLDHVTRTRRSARFARAFEALFGGAGEAAAGDEAERREPSGDEASVHETCGREAERALAYWLSHKHAATAVTSALLRVQSESDDAVRLLDAYRATLRRSAVDASGADAGGDAALAERLRSIETALGRAAIDVLDEAVTPISVADVRAALARDEAFLDVAWLERSVVVTWIDHHSSVTSVRAGSVDELAALVTDARAALGPPQTPRPTAMTADEPARSEPAPPSPPPGRDALDRLGRLLLQPVVAGRPLPDRLYVSPDGPLSLLPWDALGWHEGRLGDAVTVMRSPSPRSFVKRREEVHAGAANAERSPRPARRSRSRRSLGPPLVLADPDFGARAVDAAPTTAMRGEFGQQATFPLDSYRAWLRGLRLPRLPHSRAEAGVVRDAWPDARVLLGRDATVRALVEAQRPRALHVAAHGFLYPGGDETHPLLRPVLALAGARTVARDPEAAVGAAFLPALALMSLDVDGTELVVLSACSTSLGDLHPGEGVAGMAQALLTAGARCVIATLWRVPDDAALAVMRAFYDGLSEGSTPDAALRRVRRTARGAAGQAAEAFVAWG